MFTYFENVTDVNWDIAQFPQYPEKPGVSGKVDAHLMLVTKTSKHKDDAMKVLNVVTSDEVQLQMVRKTLRVSPLKAKEMKDQYGADLAYLKGKNLQAIFKGKIEAAPIYSSYDGIGRTIAFQQFYDNFLPGKKDLNTALNDADDLINQKLEAQKTGK
jgi:multiple sugar transport system substrate-binding protein